jgi:hypothetical protein
MEESMSSLVVSDTSGAVAGSALGSDPTEGSAKSMEEDPLVSVVIPCFNGEAFLKATIESALAQSYPRVELLLWMTARLITAAKLRKVFQFVTYTSRIVV